MLCIAGTSTNRDIKEITGRAAITMSTSFKSIFFEYMCEFLAIRQASLKSRTIIANTRQLKSFDDFLVENHAVEINKEIIDGWIASLKGSESTIQHAVCTIRLFV